MEVEELRAHGARREVNSIHAYRIHVFTIKECVMLTAGRRVLSAVLEYAMRFRESGSDLILFLSRLILSAAYGDSFWRFRLCCAVCVSGLSVRQFVLFCSFVRDLNF